jgi:hypothetical protein
MLAELTHDISPRVRDAAAHALHELHGAPDGRSANPPVAPHSVESTP